MGQQPHDGTRMEELQAILKRPKDQGRPGSPGLCFSLLWPGVGQVQDAEVQRCGPGPYEFMVQPPRSTVNALPEGNVDVEGVLRRGSGKTSWRRGLCHESYRPTGGGLEERVRVCASDCGR